MFFCQNNQWAISEPFEKQTRVPLYQRASGFGFPGVRVDGNDVLAVYAVTTRRARARPVRRRADPRRGVHLPDGRAHHVRRPDPYRIAAEVEEWKLKDPIARLKAYLSRGGHADAAFFDGIEAESDEVAAELRQGCLSLPDPDPASMFDHVYAEEHPLVAEETASVRDLPRILRGQRAGGVPVSTTTIGQGDQRRAARAPWRTTRRSSSWARTSASSAASSASPTGCRRTSARTA